MEYFVQQRSSSWLRRRFLGFDSAISDRRQQELKLELKFVDARRRNSRLLFLVDNFNFSTYTGGMGTKKDKQKIVIGLKKAKGLVEKVAQMVESDQYCVEIMQQNLAVIGLLRSVHQQVMRNHLSTCFTDGLASNNRTKQKALIKEIVQVNKLVVRA